MVHFETSTQRDKLKFALEINIDSQSGLWKLTALRKISPLIIIRRIWQRGPKTKNASSK